MVKKTLLNDGTVHRRSDGATVPIDTDDLIMYFPMAAGSGSTVHEEAKNSNNATIETGGWSDGPVRYALDLTGSLDNAAADYDAENTLKGNRPFSYAIWVKSPGATNATFAIHYNSDPHRGVDLWNLPSPAIHIINSWSGNALNVNGYTNCDDGSWHHIVVTYDGSKTPSGVTMYIDGQDQGDLNVQENQLTSDNITKDGWPMRFGSRSDANKDPDQSSDVKLAEFMLFDDRELTSTEAINIYEKTKP